MKDEYIIINKTAIQKRIEELESTDTACWEYQLGQIKELKQILSQSIPLIPEIEKAFNEAREYRMKNVFKHDIAKDYISNLKLNI